MKPKFLILIKFILIFSSVRSNLYRLNVPKILLPFYSTKITNFTLEAISEADPDTDDLCFEWSSSRPDLVSITPILDDRNVKFNGYECSHRAMISALSKYPQRMTSIIFAKEIKTNKLIRCDVIVDKIHSIRIRHTTVRLFLEDSPESLSAEALDSELNTFTSIDGLPFEWKVFNDENTHDDSRNVLRISKFIDSEYETTNSIRQLESLGLHGYKVLIEGLKTGSANVQAKLMDPFYKEGLVTYPVRLVVVANILIEPSYPVYLLKGTCIHYSAYLIKQTFVEKIIFPSQQYYFESVNSTIAKFNLKGYELMANELGTTEVILFDRNMDEKLLIDKNIDLKPPSAAVNVVEAKYLRFSIKKWSSWILESGREYEIEILLYTKDDNLIYMSHNLRIESEFPKFSVHDKSQNGSYVIAKALEKGISVIKGSLKDNNVRGEQQVEIFDPIEIRPELLVFAFSPEQVFYEHTLKVTGGTGFYFYQTKDNSIAKVDSNGLLRVNSNILGESNILVYDQRNYDIKASSKVIVVEPVSLILEPCPVETLVKSRLEINVKMNSLMQDGSIIPILDCSKINFNITIQDETVFNYVQVTHVEEVSENCARIILDAKKIGKTSIQVAFGNLNSQELKIFSLSQLSSAKNELLLAKCSSYLFSLSDGPFLNSDLHGYSSEFKASVSDLVKIEHLEYDSIGAKYTYRITCQNTDDLENEIEFTVWNKPTDQNKCPIRFNYKLIVRCKTPEMVDLSQLFVNNAESEQKIYSGLTWNCPIKMSSKFAVANLNRNLNIQLLVKDSNGREFDNFTSLKSIWNLDSKFIFEKEKINFINLKPKDPNTLVKETNSDSFCYTLFYQSFGTKERAGETTIQLKLFTDKRNYIENTLNIRFVNDVRIEPTNLVLFNHPSNIQQLKLLDGSGYFHAEVEPKEKSLLKINHISDSSIQVSPMTKNGMCLINMFDFCMPPEGFDPSRDEFSWKPSAQSSIKIAGINSILVNYEDEKIQEGQQIKIFVQIVDANGNFIQTSYFKLMNLEPIVEGDRSLYKIEAFFEKDESENRGLYILTGLKSGFLNIRFEAISENNVIKSTEKTIEIFAPISVEPKLVELILGAEYQIKYTGGPVLARDMDIKFEILDDNQFIEINNNGLVKAMAIGTSHVRVKFTNSIKHYTQDSIEFRIVELKYVKIMSPLTSIKAGNKFPVHILANNLNPFHFASSKNIQYKWSVNDAALAEIVTNYGFSVHIRTKEPGLLKLSVTATYMNGKFVDSIEVNVFPAAIFTNFESKTPPNNTILASQKTMLQMRTNYDSIYSLNFGIRENECSSSNVQISSDGLLKIDDVKADCHVGLQARISYQSKIQVLHYLVKIKEINYKMFEFDDQRISISYHDNIGDEFYVVNTKNSLLKNRNDLVEIFFLNQNIFGSGDPKSFLPNSKDNSFQLKRLNDGFLIVELNDSHHSDFIGLDTKFLSQKIHEIYIGDLICNHTAQSSSIIKSVKNRFCNIGVALEPGSITLDNNKEYLVQDSKKIYFLNENDLLTNAQIFLGEEKTTNFVEFSASPYKQDAKCSSEFESIFTEELSPFDCHVSLYNKNNKQINYLNRLVKTEILFHNQNWICKINFVSNADSELYELMSNYLKSSNKLSQFDQEPDKIKVSIRPKYASEDFADQNSQFYKFVPSFYVKTKLIEVSLSGSSHSNLVIKMASYAKANLIVSTNIPNLIRIQEMTSKDFTVIFDIEKTESKFNLDDFVQILQKNNGNLYVQVLDTLTQQIEKIPIKFSTNVELPSLSSSNENYFRCFKSSNFLFSPNIITQILILLLFAFICFLLYHKLNPTTSRNVPRIQNTPSNISPRASSFNPVQYFTPTINQSPRQSGTDQIAPAPEPRLFSTSTNDRI